MPAPRRGEVWLVDLGLAAKIRPCLVASVPAAGPNDRIRGPVVGMSVIGNRCCADWHEIIDGYLCALYDHARTNCDSLLTNARSEFLREFGTATIHGDYEQAVRAFSASLTRPPDSSAWQIVEESDDHVLVQVPVIPGDDSIHQVPFVTTRLLLACDQGKWRLAYLFEPCFWCNVAGIGSAGQCFPCQGTGRQSGLKGRIFRWIKRTTSETEQCEHCAGTGKCSRCAQEDVAGWIRGFSLRSMK